MIRTEGSKYLTITLHDGRIIQIERSQIMRLEDVDYLYSDEKREYVDLGLTVNWATCNVGADKPEDYGDYYAWGEIEIKSVYQKSNYRLHKEKGNQTIIYYDHNNCSQDTVSRYLMGFDVAQIKFGGNWRIPTVGEFMELKECCDWCWTTLNGIKGYRVSSNIEGYRDHSIFLPAAGCRFQTNLYAAGEGGYLWSSSLDKGKIESAYYLSLYKDIVGIYSTVLFDGMSIRPVIKSDKVL